MRFIPDALKQSLLDVAPAARPMVEARVETAADLRQRKDQWSQVDGGLPGTIEPLNDGGIRLLATAGAAVGPSAHPVYFTSKDTNVAGEYIDPISTAAFWSGCKFVGVRGRWTGTAANVAYGSVQAFLNPRVTGTINKYVQTWELIIYQLAYDPLNVDPTTLQPYVTLQPLVRAYTDAKLSDSPAVVTFNFTDNGLSTGKSTPWHPDVFVPDNAADPVGNRGAEYFIAIHGYDATGARSINIGWGYDNTQQSFASGSGSNFVNLDAYEVAPQVAATIPGGQVLLVASGIPHLQFVPVTFASTATVTFSAVPLDLGSVPSAASLVEFAIRAETPLGTSAPAQVQVDPAGGYVSFTDGQTADVLGLAAARKYDIKVTLNASSALDRTPIVRLLGARVVAKTDLGDVAEVIAYNEHTDPITHVSEIETCTIRGYHDGERDYRAQVQNLLSQNAPGQFYFRLYIGDRKLSKPDQWLHLDDFFPEDVDFQDAWSDILCVSCLSQLRQSLPVLSPDEVSHPSADFANAGLWTASSGSLLFQEIADLPAPPWAASTGYIVGTKAVDSNGNVQFCTVGGTSGGSAPTWSTTVGGLTNDNTVTWQNIGPLLSAQPDDTTYIQSVNNPSNTDYVASLGAIAIPQQSVGCVFQVRAATVGAAQSLSLSVFLRGGAGGTTIRASKLFTVNVQDTGQGSYQIFTYQLLPSEQANITNADWQGGLNLLFRASGTGQIRVSWARMVVLGRRAPYNTSQLGLLNAQQVMDDLVNNQINLDGRLRGQGYTNPPSGPAIPVSKVIEQDPSGSTDPSRAKAELEALAWVTGTFYMSSQGKLTNRPLYMVQTGTDLVTGTTAAIYTPLVGPIRAILDRGEVEPLAITPGWRQRIPLFSVPFQWDGSRWAGEAQVINAPALTFYRQAMIETDVRCPTETAKWIGGEGVARGLSARHGQGFGLGLMEWRFRTTYAHPEWERGDVIVVPTDRFLGFDPIATRAVVGKQYATGVIVGRGDALGREWIIWIQSLSAIRPVPGALAFPSSTTLNPNSLGVTGYIGEAAGTAAGDNLNVFWSGTSAVASVKIATSTVSQPAAGSGTLYVGQTGSQLITGPFAFGTPVFITITPYATADGSQALGRPAYVMKLIDGSSISTPYNSQGSVLPVPFGASLFTGSWGGLATGQMFVAFSWAAQTLRLPDGSTYAMTAPPAPQTMTALGQVAGGTRGATTLFARIGYVKDGHIYAVSNNTSLAVSANNVLTVAAPTNPGGYDGWCVMVGTVSGQEFLQDGTGGPAFPIPFGTNYTEPTGHFSTTPSQFAAAWQNAVVYADLAASTTFFFYPFWDIANAMVRFAPFNVAVGDTAPSMVDANKAWSDGRIALSSGGMTIAVGAGGGSGSPTTGGNRLT